MWLILILYSLLSHSFLFSINPPNDLLYSKKGDTRRKVIYMKNSEAASWSLMKSIIILIVLMAFASLIPIDASCQSDATSPTITLEDIYNDFIFQDVVVEGVIQEIVRDTVESRELGYTFVPPNKKFMIPLARLRFRVDKVLLGETDSNLIGIDAESSNIHGVLRYPYELKENQRWILALAYWNKGSYNKKYDVKYTIRRCETRFYIQGDEWIRGCWGNPSLKPYEFTRGKLEDLYKAFAELREKRSIRTLTREADLIVKGKVKKILPAKGDLTYVAQFLNIKVEKIYKGRFNNDEITISMAWKAPYKPFYRKFSVTMNEGQTWIVFLNWDDELGYYPITGLNGMFKVKGDSLIRRYIDDFILIKSLKSLEKEIKLENSKER